MERRHQVFVSSTFSDLKEERQHIIHALLELDCLPAGMELFPAADEDAWSLIKDVIDDSDYYVLVIKGRYGSCDKTGLSFTEKEFDYAVSSGKPVICFLHSNPAGLPTGDCEQTDEGKRKLENFREKVKVKLCKHWENAADLGGKLSRSLVQLRKRHPSDGWIQGKFAADPALLTTLELLRTEISTLKAELEKTRNVPPVGTDTLAQGEDPVFISSHVWKNGKSNGIELAVSWDQIFGYVGPNLMNECSEEQLEYKARLSIPPFFRQ